MLVDIFMFFKRCYFAVDKLISSDPQFWVWTLNSLIWKIESLKFVSSLFRRCTLSSFSYLCTSAFFSAGKLKCIILHFLILSSLYCMINDCKVHYHVYVICRPQIDNTCLCYTPVPLSTPPLLSKSSLFWCICCESFVNFAYILLLHN